MKASLSDFLTWQDVHQQGELLLRVAELSGSVVSSALLVARLAWPLDFGMYSLIRKFHLVNSNLGIWTKAEAQAGCLSFRNFRANQRLHLH